ncbi:MAG: hypothetical protein ABR548_05530 [Actinomycetota bacterium]|nr:hypothetical protein [Actinomycetota bacterium]
MPRLRKDWRRVLKRELLLIALGLVVTTIVSVIAYYGLLSAGRRAIKP